MDSSQTRGIGVLEFAGTLQASCLIKSLLTQAVHTWARLNHRTYPVLFHSLCGVGSRALNVPKPGQSTRQKTLATVPLCPNDDPRSRPVLTGTGPKRAPLACGRGRLVSLGGNAIGLRLKPRCPAKNGPGWPAMARHALQTSRGVSWSQRKSVPPQGGFPGNGLVIDLAMGLRPGLHEIRDTRKTLATKTTLGD